VKQVPGTLAASLDPGLRSRVEWLTTEALGTSGDWVTPSLQNGWTNFGESYAPFSYCVSGSEVSVRGLIRFGTLGSAAFTFPAGLRPSARLVVSAIAETSTPGVVAFRVDVTPGGDVLIGPFLPAATYAWVSLGFKFRAEK
jgi:hypothetical protein